MGSCSARSGARGRYENVETVSEQLLNSKLQIVNFNVGFKHDLAMCNKPPGVILFSFRFPSFFVQSVNHRISLSFIDQTVIETVLSRLMDKKTN